MTMGAAIPRPESVAVDFCSRCSERVLAASHSCSIRCSNFGRIVPFGEFVVMSCSGDGAVPYAESVWRSNTRKVAMRSEEHTSELQSLMRISYAVFCLKKNTYDS